MLVPLKLSGCPYTWELMGFSLTWAAWGSHLSIMEKQNTGSLAQTCADISTQRWHRSVCVPTTHLCFCGCALCKGPGGTKISLWFIKTNIALARSGQTHRGLGLCLCKTTWLKVRLPWVRAVMMRNECECDSVVRAAVGCACRRHIMDERHPRSLSVLSPYSSALQ